MTDFEVQQAIYSALTGPSADEYPVYDAVPQRAAYPYIALGNADASDDEEISVDSTDAFFMIHGWSRGLGKKQAWAILEFVRSRLHGQSIGDEAWSCMEDSRGVMEDPKSTADNRLFHAWARYRIRFN